MINKMISWLSSFIWDEDSSHKSGQHVEHTEPSSDIVIDISEDDAVSMKDNVISMKDEVISMKNRLKHIDNTKRQVTFEPRHPVLKQILHGDFKLKSTVYDTKQ